MAVGMRMVKWLVQDAEYFLGTTGPVLEKKNENGVKSVKFVVCLFVWFLNVLVNH